MKNFVISYQKELWIDSLRDIFIADPCISYLLEKNNELKNYNNIEIAKYSRNSKDDLINDANYVDEKYGKYIQIIARRLNYIHKKKHTVKYWKKALSLGLIRYITACFDIYTIINKNFDSEKHICNILSPKSFYTPYDFEEQRTLFQNSYFGFEQLTSVYMNLFYAGLFKEVKIEYKKSEEHLKFSEEVKKYLIIFYNNSKPKNIYSFVNKLLRDTFKILKSSLRPNRSNLIYTILRQPFLATKTFKRLFLIKKINIENKVKVGILDCFFSWENLINLIKRGDGKIEKIDWEIKSIKKSKKIYFNDRKYISEFEEDFDDFDKFFFSSMFYGLPKFFIENYDKIEKEYNKKADCYPNMNYIVGEGWISNTFTSLFLAIFQERKVKHVNNEHNSFMHFPAGSLINHIIEMSDIYVTLGWEDNLNPKTIKGASLYQFTFNQKCNMEHKILYFSALMVFKIPHISATYGNDQENVLKHINFIKLFFNNLNKETCSQISYRKYPDSYIKHLLSYNKEYLLKEQLRDVKFADENEQSIIQMRKSELIIVDYLSTAYIEALLINEPTIVLFNQDTYYMNDDYKTFFDKLIEGGIFQTNPIDAAKLVEKIKDNPNDWWFSNKVQNARKEFLDANIGKPETMINLLLEFSEK
ncbi:MAG: LIC12162 family protein [Bacteroidales bacterium]|jgi:putative transferase (TIGR04331 family)